MLQKLLTKSCLLRLSLQNVMGAMAMGEASMADISLCNVPSGETSWSPGRVTPGRGSMGGCSNSYNHMTFDMGTTYLLLHLKDKGGEGRAGNDDICLLALFGFLWAPVSSMTPSTEPAGARQIRVDGWMGGWVDVGR